MHHMPQAHVFRKNNHPADEITAMNRFYGGKTCIVTREDSTINWAHMLDAALGPSNARV